MTERAIEILGLGTVLELSIVTTVRVIGKYFLHLDELEDGTWRLIYNPLHIKDLTKVSIISFEGGALKIDCLEGEAPIKIVPVKTTANMIHLDQMRDGKWMLKYNAQQFPEMASAYGLSVIRKD